MRILVDGDACPVKKEICEVGLKYDIQVIIITSISHWSTDKLAAEYIIVDNEYQEVDIVLINQMQKNDIVITNDYGLAALVIKNAAYVLSNHGRIFTKDKIDYLLAKRHYAAKLRRQGKYLSKNNKYTRANKEEFKETLISLIKEELDIV